MDITLDTVYLTRQQEEDLLALLSRNESDRKPSGGTEMRPVGRVEYEKRKYKGISVTVAGQVEIL